MISSSQCGTHYRRIEELVNIPMPREPQQPISGSQERPNKRKRRDSDDDHEEELEDEMSQYRRIRLRSQKLVRLENRLPMPRRGPWLLEEDVTLMHGLTDTVPTQESSLNPVQYIEQERPRRKRKGNSPSANIP